MSDFHVVSKLGSGKASRVYRVHHVSSGIEMALKCYIRAQLEPYELRLIRDEIMLHSEISHPAVTTIYGGGCTR